MSFTCATYWWTARPNWGDALSPFLLARFSGITATWATPADAKLVVVGSVLDTLPPGWGGVVAGAGILHEEARVDLHRAEVLGLRGPLSAKALKLHGHFGGDFVFGDPGLLVSELFDVPEKEYDLGVCPHWTDVELAQRFAHLNAHVINPAQDPFTVITEIAKCKRIVASSLHGVIVADAFGIPRRTEMFAPKKFEGSDFKYRDYAAGLGVPFKVGVMQEIDREYVEARQSELYEMLRELPAILRGLE